MITQDDKQRIAQWIVQHGDTAFVDMEPEPDSQAQIYYTRLNAGIDYTYLDFSVLYVDKDARQKEVQECLDDMRSGMNMAGLPFIREAIRQGYHEVDVIMRLHRAKAEQFERAATEQFIAPFIS